MRGERSEGDFGGCCGSFGEGGRLGGAQGGGGGRKDGMEVRREGAVRVGGRNGEVEESGGGGKGGYGSNGGVEVRVGFIGGGGRTGWMPTLSRAVKVQWGLAVSHDFSEWLYFVPHILEGLGQ